MNTTIYSFWLGDKKRKEELLNYYAKINKIIYPWKIVLGPSEEEHKNFLENSPFYKRAYKNQIFSFCSDYYRFYKIYHNGGLYIDSGCTYNLKKIKDFINKIKDNDYAFVLERPYYLWSGFFYFKEKESMILMKCLNHLDKISKRKWNNIETAPIIISKYVFRYLGRLIEKNSNIFILKSYELDPNNVKNSIYMHPSGSWWKKISSFSTCKITPQQAWEKSYETFKKEEPSFVVYLKRWIYSSVLVYRIYCYFKR